MKFNPHLFGTINLLLVMFIPVIISVHTNGSPTRYSTTVPLYLYKTSLVLYTHLKAIFLEGVMDFKIRRGSLCVGGMKIPGGDQNPSANYGGWDLIFSLGTSYYIPICNSQFFLSGTKKLITLVMAETSDGTG